MRSAAAEEDEEEDAAQGCVGGFRLGRRVRRRVNFHPTRQQASSLPVEEDDAERESPPVPAPAVAAAAAGAVGGGGGAIWDGSGSMLLLAVVVVPVPVLWLGLTPSTVITGFFFWLVALACLVVGVVRAGVSNQNACWHVLVYACFAAASALRCSDDRNHHHSFGAADLIDRSIESWID